jgi:hypothetical protein
VERRKAEAVLAGTKANKSTVLRAIVLGVLIEEGLLPKPSTAKGRTRS